MSEVKAWCDKAVKLTDTLKQVAVDFNEISNTYEPIRDVGFANDEKEQIDKCYSDLVSALNAVKGLQAGGKRSSRKRSKRSSRTRRSRRRH
jgi:hypothetical protein